jgi:hypothetical protein
MNVSVHAHIHMIEIMYKFGLIKECLKTLFKSHSMGLSFLFYGKRIFAIYLFLYSSMLHLNASFIKFKLFQIKFKLPKCESERAQKIVFKLNKFIANNYKKNIINLPI